MSNPRGAKYIRGYPCPRGHLLFYVLGNRCVECQTERSSIYHAAHADKIRKRSAKWKRDNADRVRSSAKKNRLAVNERSRRWREKNKDRLRIKAHKKQELPNPTRPRPDACEACGRSPTDRGLCLDHDHNTGEFRGWLCYRCNVGIGYLGDTLDGVLKAADYLGKGNR